MRTLRLASRDLPLAGLVHLGVIYLVWGSTYLAIRVAVRGDAGFAPFTLGALRVIPGGILLLLWAAARRERIRPTRDEAALLLATGLLMWLGGNGLVNWAEQRLDSGYTALLIGTTPLWVAAMEALLDRRVPSPRFVGSLLVGFAGLATLTLPVLRAGSRGDAWATAGLVLAPISWGAGTILYHRRPLKLSPRVTSGFQQAFAGIGFAVTARVFGERPPPALAAREAWLAWGYLTLFGSVLAFTSYLRALRALPTSIVTTYAYVNPVVAVFLGWFLLHEPVTPWTLGGTALILAGVAGVFANR
ncbi:MAG: EamA family transporter [Acidobacteriia bacterium]|nr:EamA family transporter [Terriglobia bacterium]